MTFWRDGHVSFESLNNAAKNSKTTAIRKSIDPNTGKETKATEFNQAKWGAATNGYLDSIKSNITCGKFHWADFVKAASKFKKTNRHGESAVASSSRTAAGQDVRALIVDDSDDSDSQADTSNKSGSNRGGSHGDGNAQVAVLS